MYDLVLDEADEAGNTVDIGPAKRDPESHPVSSRDPTSREHDTALGTGDPSQEASHKSEGLLVLRTFRLLREPESWGGARTQPAVGIAGGCSRTLISERE